MILTNASVDDPPYTIYVAPATLDAGAEVVFAALAHDAAHILAELRNLRDTSNRGKYHNQRFAALANEFGFDARHAGTQWGYADLHWIDQHPAFQHYPEGRRLLLDALDQLSQILPGATGVDPPLPVCRSQRTPRPGRAAPVAICACTPPRIIRVARGVLNQGGIVCSLCYNRFKIRGS